MTTECRMLGNQNYSTAHASPATTSLEPWKTFTASIAVLKQLVHPNEKVRAHDVSETVGLDHPANLARDFATNPCLGLHVPLLC